MQNSNERDGEPQLLQGLRITFAQVRSFVTLAATENFTRTAEALNLSQPALTSRIRQLEEMLDLQLFERTPRGVCLTDAGRELLPAFLRLVNDLERAVISAKDHAARAGVTVRLACLPSCAAALLPQAIGRFKVEWPAASFVLEDSLDAQARDLVRLGKVDFGVCMGGEEASDLLAEPLLQDQLLAIVSHGHPLAERPSLQVRDLAGQSLILTQRASSLRRLVEHAFAAHGLVLTAAFEVNYMSSAVALAQAGLGVAILPSSATEIRVPDVTARSVTDPAFSRTLVLLRRREVPLRKIAAAFVEVLRATAAG